MSFTELEDFVFEKVAKTRLPGVSAAAIRDGEVVWAKGFGYRNLADGLAATPHTLYSVGSVTKSFTSVAILQLVEQGKLSLDTPVGQIIPFEIQPCGETVKVWHLLSHTSGIPALAYAESVIRGATGAGESWLPVASGSDMLTFLREAGDWALNKPGERWFYLNEGYVLLSMIIEKLSGMRYQEYVTEKILKPLGMTRSFFAKQDVDSDPDAAVPYIVADDGERKPSAYAYGLSGDGGLISNVLDLAKYVTMYLGWGTGGGGQVLARSSVEEMETPRISTPNKGGPFGDYLYALGLGTYKNFMGQILVGHSGSVGVATAYIGFIPEKNVGIALLANASGYALSQLGMAGLAVLLGEKPESLPFVRRENALSELEGTYETYKGTMKAQVKKMGDFLAFETRTRYDTEVVPLIPDTVEGNVRTFHTLSGGNRIDVEFRVQEGEIGLIYERYYLKRTGKI
ncbi:MAG: serine hydrolase [Chloroflexi bacterium]|nr:serine hydrolase [Chloroflexota bacterium]